MKKIKIIKANGEKSLQQNIDKWIVETNPIIISTSITCKEGYEENNLIYLAITYEESQIKL